jgi:hypothetical protein
MKEYNFININNLLGGAKCPTTGYRQHEGECWHDSFSTILTFGNFIGDTLQQMFDQIPNAVEFERHITHYIIRNHDRNKIFLPFFIDDATVQQYFTISIEYIKSLYIRYKNQELIDRGYIERTKENLRPKHLQMPYRHGPLERKIFRPYVEPEPYADVPRRLERQDSFYQSIVCIKTIYDIVNLYRINKTKFKIKKHGGSIAEYYIISTIINYIFSEGNNYISLTNKRLTSDIYDGNFYNDIDDLIHNSFGVLLDLDTLIYNIEYPEDSEFLMGHVQGFYYCGDERTSVFYDDNGIESTFVGEDEYINNTRTTIKFPPKLYKEYFLRTYEKNINNWKEYLRACVQICRENNYNYIDDKHKIIDIFNDFFIKIDSTLYISNFVFIIVNRYDEHEYINNTMKFLYDNDMIYEYSNLIKILKYIDKEHIIKLIEYHLINNNIEIVKNILQHLPPDSISQYNLLELNHDCILNKNNVKGNLIHYILTLNYPVQNKVNLISELIDLISNKNGFTPKVKNDFIIHLYTIVDQGNNSIVHYASQYNVLKIIQTGIALNPDSCKTRNIYGLLPIDIATIYDNLGGMLLLARITERQILKPEIIQLIDNYKLLIQHIP